MAKPKRKSSEKRRHPGVRGTCIATRVRALSIHQDYRCSNSGVCCNMGWDIPLDSTTHARLRAHIKRGEIDIPGSDDLDFDDLLWTEGTLPRDAKSVLGHTDEGRCHFFEADGGNLCAIHRQVGPDPMPVACRVFPRMCVIRPSDVAISLSHFCPTAAAMLFRENMPLKIVDEPMAFPTGQLYGGHDARDHLPPLIRPNTPMSWAACDLWEQHAVETMAREDLSPEEALALLCQSAEQARGWSPESDDLDIHLMHTFTSNRLPSREEIQLQCGDRQSALATSHFLWTKMLGTIPSDKLIPVPACRGAVMRYSTPPDQAGRDLFLSDWQVRAEDQWRECATPIRRYLAARLYANFYTHQCDGLRSALFSIICALAVLRVMAAAHSGVSGCGLSRDQLIRAFRDTDYLLLHAADRSQIRAICNVSENITLASMLSAIPL